MALVTNTTVACTYLHLQSKHVLIPNVGYLVYRKFIDCKYFHLVKSADLLICFLVSYDEFYEPHIFTVDM